jgi:beta-glucosidase
VKNVGLREGDEVVELYLIPPTVAGAPRLSLQGVRRAHLRAAESKLVEFILQPEQMSLVDAQGKRVLHPGRCSVFVGGEQPDKQAGVAFEITGEKPLNP